MSPGMMIMGYVVDKNECFLSDLDLYLNSAGELETHQRIYRLRRRAVNVDESLVGVQFKLLARLLVHVRRTENRVYPLVGGKGHGTADHSSSGLHRLHDLLS